MLKKFNTVAAGAIIGVIIPLILYFIFVYPKMKHFSFIDGYYREMVIKFLPLFLSRCIFPNALLFFILVWQNQIKIAKGLLISSAVLTSILLLISFIL
ncbi:MAG: hypothetical protein JW894_10185 [Bacteroidales bacterium]|nr:hypothetical protein [Bacteroidales bacterium]